MGRRDGWGWRLAVVVVALLVAAGCEEGALDDLQSRVDEAVDDAGSQIGEAVEEAQSDLADVDLSVPTELPTTDEEAVAPEPSPEPSVSATPEPTDAGEVAGLPWWAWVLALLALVGLAMAAARARSRRLARAVRRRELRDAVLTDLDWLLQVAQDRPVAVDAAPRARDVRVRADRLQERLTAMAAATAEKRRSVVSGLHEPVRELANGIIERLDAVAAGRTPTESQDLWGRIERLRQGRARLASTFGEIGTDEPRRRTAGG